MQCFKNIEFIIGVICGIAIVILTMLINVRFTDKAFDKLKMEYIDMEAILIGKFYEVAPNNTNEIMPILKSKDKRYRDEGLSVLKKYGYDKNISKEFITPIEKSCNEVKKNNILFNIGFSISIFIVMIIAFNSIYKKIRILTKYIKGILEGNFEDTLNNKYSEGDYGRLVFVFDDVRKRLKQNIDNLSNEKKFLTNILADISHQLKTPLSSLRMYNEILISDELSLEERNTFLENSKIQLNRMEWLIKNLLKLAKLDAGAIEFNIKLENINETIGDSLDILYSKAKEKGIDVIFNEKPIQMFHDREWLSEALINIIKNSIEHTEKGGVIKISLQDNLVYTKIIIEDTGVGIEKEDLPKIFNRFYKSKNNKNKESVGIGLALSNSIVKANGGIIEVESKVSKGTKFILTFFKYNNILVN